MKCKKSKDYALQVMRVGIIRKNDIDQDTEKYYTHRKDNRQDDAPLESIRQNRWKDRRKREKVGRPANEHPHNFVRVHRWEAACFRWTRSIET